MALNDTKKSGRKSKVLICGSYGHGNAGDEAILEAITASLRGADENIEITVMSRSPEYTRNRHGVSSVHKFNLFSVLGQMMKSDLYINGGGSLIQDITSRRSLYYYLFTIMAAKILGCKVMMYGCGIGPVTRKNSRALTKFIVDKFADEITLREEDSLDELKAFGIDSPEMQVASDPALGLPSSPKEEVHRAMHELGLSPDEKYLCIVPRKWQGFSEKVEEFAECADFLSEKYGLTTLFVSIDHKNDSVAAEMIAKHMKTKYHILRDILPTGLTIGFLAEAELVISMRLHGLVFAAGQGIPLVGVAYDPKVTAFLKYLGKDSYIELGDLTGGKLKELSQSALALWNEGDLLQDRVKSLREIESRNIRSAMKLLNKKGEG